MPGREISFFESILLLEKKKKEREGKGKESFLSECEKTTRRENAGLEEAERVVRGVKKRFKVDNPHELIVDLIEEVSERRKKKAERKRKKRGRKKKC